MIIDGQQEGLLFLGGPPLVDGGIMLPEFINARAFPATPGFGTRLGLGEKVWKMGSGEGRHRFPVAFEMEARFQFVGHELEVGGLLQGEERFKESHGFGRPVWPMVAAGELGGELRAVQQPAGAESVKVGAADLEVNAGLGAVNRPCIELTEDFLEEQVGEALGDLLFL